MGKFFLSKLWDMEALLNKKRSFNVDLQEKVI